MSLYGNRPRHTWGAIRNAQTMPLFYPGWVLRVYLAQVDGVPDVSWLVPRRIVARLKSLGVQMVYVDARDIRLHPRWWSYLVADDVNVERFVVRSADARIGDREFSAVRRWMDNDAAAAGIGGGNSAAADTGFAFHCIRDHPRHVDVPIVDGLWGGRPAGIRDVLRPSMHRLLTDYSSNGAGGGGGGHEAPAAAALPLEPFSNQSSSSDVRPGRTDRPDAAAVRLPEAFLRDVLWPLVAEKAYCADSVSCKRWTGARPFKTARVDRRDYVGRRYNEHHEPIDVDGDDAATLSKVAGDDDGSCSGGPGRRSSAATATPAAPRPPTDSPFLPPAGSSSLPSRPS